VIEPASAAVRDRLVLFLADWLDRLESTVLEAQAEGAIDPEEDPAQLAFEVEAALFLANAQYVVTRTSQPIEHARRAIELRLATALTSAPSVGRAHRRRSVQHSTPPPATGPPS